MSALEEGRDLELPAVVMIGGRGQQRVHRPAGSESVPACKMADEHPADRWRLVDEREKLPIRPVPCRFCYDRAQPAVRPERVCPFCGENVFPDLPNHLPECASR